jgi:hypothetical protein
MLVTEAYCQICARVKDKCINTPLCCLCVECIEALKDFFKKIDD